MSNTGKVVLGEWLDVFGVVEAFESPMATNIEGLNLTIVLLFVAFACRVSAIS